jgi:hypothetical protein
MEVCARLENTARDTFSRHRWQHNLRIGPPTPLGAVAFDHFDM